jgi:hypothetical protein
MFVRFSSTILAVAKHIRQREQGGHGNHHAGDKFKILSIKMTPGLEYMPELVGPFPCHAFSWAKIFQMMPKLWIDSQKMPTFHHYYTKKQSAISHLPVISFVV